jgi:hypothetical protein
MCPRVEECARRAEDRAKHEFYQRLEQARGTIIAQHGGIFVQAPNVEACSTSQVEMRNIPGDQDI